MTKRVRVMCAIHEGSIGTNKIKQLESVIASTYQAHFGANHKLTFVWMTIPDGQAYLAAQPSNASTLQAPVKDGLPAKERHAFMSEICAKWMHIVGCSKDEIILVAADFIEFEAFSNVMVNRIDKKSRKKTLAKMFFNMLKGKLSKGYLTTSINL